MGRINTHLAHDMRTPLQLIYSCAQMIQSELNDPGIPAGRYAKILMENVESLQAMITSELDASECVCDIVRLTCDYCRRTDIQAASKGVSLLFSTNTAHLKLRLDKTKYLRILQNLVSNALHFTPANGFIKISVRAMGDTVEVSVTDSGPGIHPDMQKNIFEHGKSLDGYGIGLSIVQKFTRELGGRIILHSAPGKGAAFILRLPISRNNS